MPPNQGNGPGTHIAARVPTNRKSALEKWAHADSTPHETVTASDKLRNAIDEYLADHWDELPEEARDDLDDDLKPNGGDGGTSGNWRRAVEG